MSITESWLSWNEMRGDIDTEVWGRDRAWMMEITSKTRKWIIFCLKNQFQQLKGFKLLVHLHLRLSIRTDTKKKNRKWKGCQNPAVSLGNCATQLISSKIIIVLSALLTRPLTHPITHSLMHILKQNKPLHIRKERQSNYKRIKIKEWSRKENSMKVHLNWSYFFLFFEKADELIILNK